MHLVACHRSMFDSLGHDEHLAGVERDGAIAQLDVEGAPEHEEKIIGVIVLVPVVWTHELGDLDVVVVVCRDGPRRERLGESCEFFGQICGRVHCFFPAQRSFDWQRVHDRHGLVRTRGPEPEARRNTSIDFETSPAAVQKSFETGSSMRFGAPEAKPSSTAKAMSAARVIRRAGTPIEFASDRKSIAGSEISMPMKRFGPRPR